MKKELYENIYDKKFSFWKNWAKFLEKLDEKKIEQAKNYLEKFIWWKDKIEWKTVIDFGSWSWLMSLCFYLLWAKKIVSVDIDNNSLDCTRFLKEKYANNTEKWEIKKWSVLDEQFIKRLWKFDIVYSWGVIHHTWNMWKWLELIEKLVNDNWLLYLTIYNKYNWFPSSDSWLKIKKIYVNSPFLIKKVMYYWLILENIFMRIIRGQNPVKYIKNYYKNSNRWMDFFRDIEDWLWWYPYEYATIEEIKNFYENIWYKLINLYDSSAWWWCNEFLFAKIK